MNRLARIAAVLLPAFGLAALWVESHLTYNEGTEWDVPVMGYDPRDMLRGHYVEFTASTIACCMASSRSPDPGSAGGR